jgi:hypothetical protein
MLRFVLRAGPGGRGSRGCAALCEFLIPPARALPAARPVHSVGSSNRFDAVRLLERCRDNVSVFLVVAVTMVALLALVAAFVVSVFCAAVLATLSLSLHRRYVRRRRDAGPADQRSKRVA